MQKSKISLRTRIVVVGAATLVAACTTQQVLDVALAKDPKVALTNMANNRVEAYKRDPQLLVADFDKLQVELKRLFGQVK